ncbi:MAG TPA: DEAD/DEAH box helicase [Candidatus Saccharimonadales bacterium]|nr:DEAD/DEAH box helicase [Candidatus Saccharimonadales bacterium]
MSYFNSGRSRFNGGRSKFGGNSGGPRRGGYSQGGGRRNGANKQYIDPSRFIKAAKQVEEEVYVPKHSFADFNINPLIKKNIEIKGFTTPSKIQDQAIPFGLDGKDVIGIANTGTGKTTAFALPVINQLMEYPQAKALILAPTRELAMQIEEECRSFAKGSGLRGALVIGGAPMYRQTRDLQNNPNIVIGTPGRLKDHFNRGNIDLSKFTIVVLDEVDRMVDMGFINDIRMLLGEVSEVRQSLFFSATMDAKIESLINTFMTEPVKVSVRTSATSDNVEQNVVHHTKNDKLEKLHDILSKEHVSKTLVFDETQRNVEKLSQELYNRGFSVESLHGGKSQGQRLRALKRFKNNEVTVLVATDVAARGIDVADITHVINYTTPNSYDDYTHRVGRAGRAGRKGYALTFVEKY